MQVQGGTEWFKQTGALSHLTVSGQQAQADVRATQQRKRAAATSVEISDEGKALYTKQISEVSSRAEFGTQQLDDWYALPDSTGNFFKVDQALKEDPELAALCETLVSQEAYDAWKASNAELVKEVTEGYDAWVEANRVELHVGAVDGLDADKIAQMRQNGMHLLGEKLELSASEKQYLEVLKKATGEAIVSKTPGHGVWIHDDGTRSIGMEFLEFMAEHSDQQSIWEGMMTKQYKSLGEVDQALRAAGDDETADALRKSVVGEPPKAEELRETIVNQIKFSMPIYLGRTEAERRQAGIDSRLKRDFFVDSVVTPELIERFRDVMQKKNEALADALYKSEF